MTTDDHPDTPEPPAPSEWREHDGYRPPRPNDPYAATPEGGQPDTDDELLARWQQMVGRPGEYGHGAWVSIANGLASALRRRDAEADQWKTDAKQYAQKAERWHEEADRLERELAKARERADDWEKIAADYRRGTVTVTDGMLDDWIEALRSGNAIVFGPPQANGLADRLAEARSHSEVLAKVITDDNGYLASSLLVLYRLRCPPGTEVVVAEASVWEALEEIRQRVADGWAVDRGLFVQRKARWMRPGRSPEPISPEVAAVLWPSTEDETA